VTVRRGQRNQKGRPYLCVLPCIQDEIFSIFSHLNPINQSRCSSSLCTMMSAAVKADVKRKLNTFKWTYIAVCQHDENKSWRQGQSPWKCHQPQGIESQVQGSAAIRVSIADCAYDLGSNLVEEARGIRRPLNGREFDKFDFLRETTRIILVVNPLCKGGVRVSDIHCPKIASLY
jgi:hypothetical protein